MDGRQSVQTYLMNNSSVVEQLCSHRHLGIKSKKTAVLLRKLVEVKTVQTTQIMTCGLICMYVCTVAQDSVQVAQVPVQCLRQWLDEKAPPVQVAEGDTTTCASGLSVLVAE